MSKMEDIVKQLGRVPPCMNTGKGTTLCTNNERKRNQKTTAMSNKQTTAMSDTSDVISILDSEINRLSKEYDQKLEAELSMIKKLERRKSEPKPLDKPLQSVPPPPPPPPPPSPKSETANGISTATPTPTQSQIIAKIEENKREIASLEKRKNKLKKQSIFDRLHNGQSSVSTAPKKKAVRRETTNIKADRR